MNYLVRLNIARRESMLEVVDAETGEVLAARTFANPELGRGIDMGTLYHQRNLLCDALSSEPATLSVVTETTDWRS